MDIRTLNDDEPAPRVEPEDVVQMFIDAIQVDHLTDEQVEMLLDIFDN